MTSVEVRKLSVKKFNEARKASDDTVNIISAEQWAKGLLLE